MTDPWEAFWLASELSPTTGPALAAHMSEVDQTPPPSRFVYPAPPALLPRTSDRALEQRRTIRKFAPGPLSTKQLGSLLSAFATTAGRAWPSAGGLYPLEVFVLLLDVDHPLNRRVTHYEPAEHGLTDIQPSPSWAELKPILSADVIEGAPQLLVVFVLDTAAMEAKYGPRGGRFALIEVGHAAQNLALRLAADGLAGCELGGAYDRALLDVLGLGQDAQAKAALAYACGLGLSERPAGRRRTRGSRWGR